MPVTFDVCASSTNLTICERVVSVPTCVASMSSIPCWLILPPITVEPVKHKHSNLNSKA